MKMLAVLIQVIALACPPAFADTAVSPVQTTVSIPPRPKAYRLANMHLLDSVAFYNKYKNSQGQRIVVQGYSGRFGATFGEEFLQKIYEIEYQHQEKVEIILTLDSTIEDAKILQKQMADKGRKMVIVPIPDEVQKQILEKAAAQAQGGLKKISWEAKDAANKLMHPAKTASDAYKIIKNQYMKPTKKEIFMTAVLVGETGASGALALSVGVDPALAIPMTLARMFFTGVFLGYQTTVNNVFKSDIFTDLSVVPLYRQILSRLSTIGLGVGETYLAIGTRAVGPAFGLTQQQIVSNLITSGIIDNAQGITRMNNLSDTAIIRMTYYSATIAIGIEMLMTAGLVGPMVLEYSIFQISALQTGAIAFSTFLLVSYKFFSKQVEALARVNPLQAFPEAGKLFKKLAQYKKPEKVPAGAHCAPLFL